MRIISPGGRLILLATAWLVCLSTANAQLNFDGLAGGLVPDEQSEPVSLQAEFTAANGANPGRLYITAKIRPGWHIYSLTQAPGGPVRTKISIPPSPDFKLIGDFTSSPAPLRHKEELFKGLTVETHGDTTVWSAPLELASGVAPNQLQISGKVLVQACSNKNCLPPTSIAFKAALGRGIATESKKTAATGVYENSAAHAIIRGKIEPAIATPGSKATLTLSAQPAEGWHLYGRSDAVAQSGPKPTLIVLSATSGLPYHAPLAQPAPLQKKSDVPGFGTILVHSTPVQWTIEIDIPKDMSAGDYRIAGLIGYMTCQADSRCDLPQGARFEGSLVVGPKRVPGAMPLAFSDARYIEAAQLASTGSPASTKSTEGATAAHPIDWSALPLMLFLAISGGMILNLMPCVLPVIALKILSFVDQGGRQRGHVLALNLWYTAGLMFVFMVLATLSVSLNLGWGEQFSSTAFNVIMCAVLFIMALSFLGVWEIPIPGFVGSGKAAELATHEGAVGAFTKGVVTTILATPCSGPFLGSVFGFTLKQPPFVTYAIFGCIGLGMASPYLIIGAFPRLIRFLPKPGAWMDTFKQIMGFVLLGTIVFLFTFMNRDYVVPTFALLVGLWAGCWWIGRTHLTAELPEKMRAWGIGAAFAAAVGWFAFTSLVPHDSLVPWQPFSRAELARLSAEGKTVVVDFSADWCLTCKYNLNFVLNTDEVHQAIKANNAVPLLADWTDGSIEIKEMLESLKSNSIPLLAIYPANKPNDPIVLRDVVQRQQVIDAINEAGPSKSGSDARVTSLQMR
jgi:suppressor for copper-sensitivity B